MAYTIGRIEDLSRVNLTELIRESELEGYRFVRRLAEDYEKGRNRFDQPGEGLFGVWDEAGKIVAVGGVNRSPFSEDGRIGRLRRFYVHPNARRQGIGSLLVKEITQFSKESFHEMTLRTDSSKADAFYLANGFTPTDHFPESTHRMTLN